MESKYSKYMNMPTNDSVFISESNQSSSPCYSNISKTSSNQQLLSLPNCRQNTCLKPWIKFYIQFLVLLLFCSYWIWAGDLSFQLCPSEQIWHFPAGEAQKLHIRMTGRQSGTMVSQMRGPLTKIWISLTTVSTGLLLLIFVLNYVLQYKL